MIYCPAGKVIIGSEDGGGYHQNEFQHAVLFEKGFWLGETPITQEQYKAIISSDKSTIFELADNSPAIQLTWVEAFELCKLLNQMLSHRWSDITELDATKDYHVTLPSEYQWEYAARAQTSTRWFFGDDETQLSEYAWYGRDTQDISAIPNVKSKNPNPWGLYDLYGLVHEWCLNDATVYDEGKPLNVTIPQNDDRPIAKVTRGGNIYSKADECRSSVRYFVDHWNSDNDITGVRILLEEV